MKKKQININFEGALQELNDLIEKMEQDDLALEAALKYFEQGVALIRQCQTTLREAEQKVQILAEKNGQLTLETYQNAAE